MKIKREMQYGNIRAEISKADLQLLIDALAIISPDSQASIDRAVRLGHVLENMKNAGY